MRNMSYMQCRDSPHFNTTSEHNIKAAPLSKERGTLEHCHVEIYCGVSKAK